MPMQAIHPHAAMQTATPDAIVELADGLCDLSLTMANGPTRQNLQAMRLVGRQMDDALRGALGAPQGQTAQALAVMRELTGAPVTEAELHDSALLEQAFPDIRLAIGRVALFYRQAYAQPVVQAQPSDAYQPASGPAGRRDRAASVAMPAPQPVPQPPTRVPLLDVAVTYQSASSLANMGSAGAAGDIPASACVGAVQATNQSHRTATLPDSLQRCLRDLEWLSTAPAEPDGACFICPTSGAAWCDPIFDMRDGRSYEAHSAPSDLPKRFRVKNTHIRDFVRVYREHQDKDACELAARLEKTCPRDAENNLIVNPVRTGFGQYDSAAALVADFHAGRVPDGLHNDWAVWPISVDKALVKLMSHYDIGAAEPTTLTLPAVLWNGMPSFDSLAPKHHTDCDVSEDEFLGLWDKRVVINNLRQHKAALTQAQVIYEHTMLDCNSDDYNRAFHGGLRINALVARLDRLINAVYCLTTQAHLKLMRAAGYRLRGDIDQAVIEYTQILARDHHPSYVRQLANGGLAFARVLQGATNADKTLTLCGKSYSDDGAPIQEKDAVLLMRGDTKARMSAKISERDEDAEHTRCLLKEARRHLRDPRRQSFLMRQMSGGVSNATIVR